MIKLKIDEKYLNQHSQLEIEFFDIVDKGLPSQHRVLKVGKLIIDFDQRHGDIWKAHTAELITAGFIEAPKPPEPVRDLATEIDEINKAIGIGTTGQTGISQRLDNFGTRITTLETK